MNLKTKGKIKGDWKNAEQSDKQKYENIEEIHKEIINGVEKDVMIDSVEPCFRSNGTIHCYKTKSHFV